MSDEKLSKEQLEGRQSVKLTDKLHYFNRDGGREYIFLCPACSCLHRFDVGTKYPAQWKFNDNAEKPTFTPSLRYLGSGCHLNVTDGKIIYHGDCPHEMKGKTVDMEPI